MKERERNTRKDDKGRILKKGEGQDKNGRYYFVFAGSDGKRHRIYNTDLVALRGQEKELQKDINDDINIWAGKKTLNEQFERYIKTKDVKADTIALYKEYWNREVKESIGKMKLSDIKKSDLKIFYKSLKDKTLSDSTIRIYGYNLIGPTLELALDDGIIRKNPNKGCMKEYTGKPKEKEVLTEEQQAAFMEFVKTSKHYDIYYPLFQFMFSTACRFGEVAGVTWQDVDFENRTIRIGRQMKYKNYGNGCERRSDEPKTDAGFRTIPMTQNCYRALKLQREWQFALGVDRSKEYAGVKGLVFTTFSGSPLIAQNVYALIKKLVKRYNEQEADQAARENRTPIILPKISSHTFRHTGCTRLAETGIDVKSLQEYMGHSDINVTMSIYNHVVGDRLKNEIEKAEKKSEVI